ncbi:MAG: hypothetical protein OEV15_08745, partial [Gallionella sp.]|nr:hypothetical protein [Gallionella sp.]
MFTTIRAKLIGFSFFSLLFIVLVSVVGNHGKSELGRVSSYSQGNIYAFNTNMRANMAHEEVRADVLQILRVSKIGDTAAYKDASTNLNEHLKILDSSSARLLASTALLEKTRQAASAVRMDIEGYAKSAQSILSMAQADSAGAEMQFAEFDEKYKKLKTNQSILNNLIAADMEAARQAID